MTEQTFSIATWNVNSIRSRLPHLLDWLRHDAAPDIICLQELKAEDDMFPWMEVEEMGYNVVLQGQKSYNGVAILSKFPLEDVVRGLPGDDSDTQARYIEALAQVGGSVVRVASVYVPNGQAPDSDKFTYKMGFFDRLQARLATLLSYDEVTVIGGDYNVAPDALDVYDPKSLEGTVCFHPLEREKLRRILNLGYYDAFRVLHPEKQQFSWWDYRGSGWTMNKGLRIDHLLLSPKAVDCMTACDTISDMRGAERASDHAPVTGCFHLREKKGVFAA